jgi:Ca2+-binding EF-hand superfamily protein
MPPKPTTQAVSSTPSFDASKYVNSKMNLETVNKLKEVFDLFDADGSGQISIPEIVDTIKAL